MANSARAVRVLHGKVVWGKHRNDYPCGRDKGATVGGNVRYDRVNPTRGMVPGKGYKKTLDANDAPVLAS
jgi:hypothetical protein